MIELQQDKAQEMLGFKCPKCAQQLEAEYDMAGQIIKCPECSYAVTIPKKRKPKPQEVPIEKPTEKPKGSKKLSLLRLAKHGFIYIVGVIFLSLIIGAYLVSRLHKLEAELQAVISASESANNELNACAKKLETFERSLGVYAVSISNLVSRQSIFSQNIRDHADAMKANADQILEIKQDVSRFAYNAQRSADDAERRQTEVREARENEIRRRQHIALGGCSNCENQATTRRSDGTQICKRCAQKDLSELLDRISGLRTP